MTALETTRRDLALLEGWCFCPTTWERITPNDTIMGADGRTRHILQVERHFETAIVSAMLGAERQVGEKRLDDPVLVLQGPTGHRLEEHRGADPVRYRKRKTT